MLPLHQIACGCQVHQLVQELFHFTLPEEPVRPTRNLSLPAAHFTPRLLGHMLGLAHTGAPWEQIEATLRAEGIAAVAKKTRVSIARFCRLVQTLQRCVESDELWQREVTDCATQALM